MHVHQSLTRLAFTVKGGGFLLVLFSALRLLHEQSDLAFEGDFGFIYHIHIEAIKRVSNL